MKRTMQRWRTSLRICALLLGATIGSFPTAASAQVNVCRWVWDWVLKPPTYQSVVTCDNRWEICTFVDPACCVPVVCNILPHCQITSNVLLVAESLSQDWVFRCDLVDPAQEFQRWLRQQIPSLDDALLPGAFDVARVDIAAMMYAASPIPANAKVHIEKLIETFVSGNTSKFSNVEINAARIISNTNSNASLYLWSNYGAMTLKDLIIVRDTYYQTLTSKANQYTAAQVLAGVADPTYNHVLLLLVHELVHVAQYRSLGLDAFLTNYLLNAIVNDYPSIAFEMEAYVFEDTVSQRIGSGSGSSGSGLTAATVLASKFGVSAAAVAANSERWSAILRWFRTCVQGEQRARETGRHVPSQCLSEATKRFGIDADAKRYPLPSQPVFTGVKMKMPDGRTVLRTPKPQAPPPVQDAVPPVIRQLPAGRVVSPPASPPTLSPAPQPRPPASSPALSPAPLPTPPASSPAPSPTPLPTPPARLPVWK